MGFAPLGVAAALGTQVLHIAASLPQYELNVQRKLKTLEATSPYAIASSASPARPTCRTIALNDAGDRLSRPCPPRSSWFNLAFGVAIWMSLGMLRLPQALLCVFLAGVMRFVPYLGVGIAAKSAAIPTPR